MNVLAGSQNAHVEHLNASQVIHYSAEDKSLYELLQPIEDASHTRDRRRSPPDSACTKGTRVGVVMKVTTWAASDISDPDEPHILWMHGYVGCGKSAISQEVCDKSDRQGRPVVSFFFFRNAGDRSRIWRLPTTLASQMATIIPETEPFIRAAVKANPTLTRPDEGRVSLKARMQRLIYMPFKASLEGGGVRGLARGPFLIVLDGLDECDDKSQVQELIEDMLLFFEENPSIPLRVFITSRVEQHIQSHLDVPGVRLENLVDHCSHHDIATFLEVLFDQERRRNPVIRAYIRQHGEWPTSLDKLQLVNHIGGSFIFASSLFKYIMGLSAGDGSTSPTTPMDRLPHTLKMNPGLDGLYAQTLARSEHLPHFLTILSTIALLGIPLSTSGIAELLGISTYAVVNVLVNLQAIIQVPGTDDIPVTICHTSLRDFLTTESRSGRYYAHPRHHVHLFLRCLERELELRQRTPGVLIPPSKWLSAFDYAENHSGNHWYYGDGHFELSDWASAIQLWRQTLEVLPVLTPGHGLEDFRAKTYRMAALPWMMNVKSLPSYLKKEAVGWYVLSHPRRAITTAPRTANTEKRLEVSVVRTLSLTHHPHWFYRFPSFVKFSADGKFLAVGYDGSARIHNTQTGMETCTFVQPSAIWCMCFSPCGKWLATAAEDSIRVWDIAKKCIRGTFEGHQAAVVSLGFFSDGRLLVSGGRDGTVRVYNVGSALGNLPSSSTTTCGSEIGSGHGAEMTNGAAKPIVLTVTDDASETMRDIDVDGDTVYPSNDPNHQSGGGSGNLMDVDHESSEKTTTTNDDLRHKILSMAVSPDGQYVATGSDDGVIRLWDLRRTSPSVGERQSPVLIERLKVHSDVDIVHAVLFSPNGRFLVSTGFDGPVRVWDLDHLGIAPTPGSLSSSSLLSRDAGNGNPPKGNDCPVMGGQGKQKSRCTMQLVGNRGGGLIAVSPDGRWVVCGEGHTGAMWWDLEPSSAEDSSSSHGEASTMTAAVTERDKEAVCVLNGHQTNVLSVDLSPVGNMLATGGVDGVRIWNYKFTRWKDDQI